MHFADLLRSSSTHRTSGTKTMTIHGSLRVASASPHPRSSTSSQPHSTVDTNNVRPGSGLASHFSTITDTPGIGQAPSHPQSCTGTLSKRTSAAESPESSSLPHLRTSKAIAPSFASNPFPDQHAGSSAHDSISTPGIKSSSSTTALVHHAPSSSTHLAAQQPSIPESSSSTSLLRRRSTKTKPSFPPASSSTGTSGTLRDRSTVANSIFRRPSLGRRTGSIDPSLSSAGKTVTQGTSSISTPGSERTPSNMASVAAPTIASVAAPATATPPSSSTNASPGRFARLFRRKSISGPIRVTIRPDLISHPVPVIPATDSSVNITKSPPLAVISAEPRPTPAAAKVDASGATETITLSVSPDSVSSKLSSFAFPLVSDHSKPHPDLSLADQTGPNEKKQAANRSAAVTAMLVSASVEVSTAQESAKDASTAPAPQRRASIGRRFSQNLSEKRRSKSFSMVGSLFGGSSHADSISSTPPLPHLAASLSQIYPAADLSTSERKDSTGPSHSRKTSLRSRLGMARSAAQRPSTPEIESWRGTPDMSAVDDASADTGLISRNSIENLIRPKGSDMPVVVSRSKSAVRRKPAPEVKQEEIDSSSSTPVYGKAYCTLDVDGSPRGGSPASSHRALAPLQTGSDPEPELDQEVLVEDQHTASGEACIERSQSDPGHLTGLGLIGTRTADPANASNFCPSVEVRVNTPPRDASSTAKTGGVLSTREPAQQKLAAVPSHTVAIAGRSPDTRSVAGSVDRSRSPISDADTPILKLRQLVVDTEAHDDDRDNGLFFKPVTKATNHADKATIDAAEKAESLSEAGSEQLDSSSQTTTQSDTKHEMASSPSPDFGTTNAVRSLAAQQSSSGLFAATVTLSDASAASLGSTFEQPGQIADLGADSVGPLPSRSRQHRLEGSTGSVYSQMTLKQAHRASTASRMTARSSGHWSESRLSEDALSVLEAEVGQARRAEVIALGKGRVMDWVGGGGAQRALPTAEAPVLSRSNTLTKKLVDARLEDREVQRQQRLNDQLGRRLQQLSDAQVDSGPATVQKSVDDKFRDASTQNTRTAGLSELQAPSASATSARTGNVAPRLVRSLSTRSARLSAFHDRNPMGATVQLASRDEASTVVPSVHMEEEAVRLGRAPSKRVRRNVGDAQSAGEAVIVQHHPASHAQRVEDDLLAAPSQGAARHMERSVSLSPKKAGSASEQSQPAVSPSLSFAPLLSALDLLDSTDASQQPGDNSKPQPQPQQASYATSEEAAHAKQLELVKREKQLAQKDAKRQAHLQEKYAKKKQNDPLLAARLALVGLQPSDAMPQLQKGEPISVASMSATSSKTSVLGPKTRHPPVPERRASSQSRVHLAVSRPSVTRNDSNAGSVASFHTAVDAPLQEARSPLSGAARQIAAVDGREGVRTNRSDSFASSLAEDMEFPAPPERMREQLSEDGTVLGHARLQRSPVQPQWRERRHYAPGTSDGVGTPPRDSSLRHRPTGMSRSSSQVSRLYDEGQAQQGMTASMTMPELAVASVKQSMPLRRSRSTEFSNRDLRKLAREQMMQDVSMHPSPKRAHQPLLDSPARGLGIELGTNASGTATPSAIVGASLHAIAA